MLFTTSKVTAFLAIVGSVSAVPSNVLEPLEPVKAESVQALKAEHIDSARKVLDSDATTPDQAREIDGAVASLMSNKQTGTDNAKMEADQYTHDKNSADVAQLLAEMATLKEENAALKGENADLKGENADLKGILSTGDDLTQEVTTKDDKSTDANLISAPRNEANEYLHPYNGANHNEYCIMHDMQQCYEIAYRQAYEKEEREDKQRMTICKMRPRPGCSGFGNLKDYYDKQAKRAQAGCKKDVWRYWKRHGGGP